MSEPIYCLYDEWYKKDGITTVGSVPIPVEKVKGVSS
jgi:hypothetical protein